MVDVESQRASEGASKAPLQGSPALGENLLLHKSLIDGASKFDKDISTLSRCVSTQRNERQFRCYSNLPVYTALCYHVLASTKLNALGKSLAQIDLDGHDMPPSPAPSSPRSGKQYNIATQLVYSEGNDQYNASSVPIYQV